MNEVLLHAFETWDLEPATFEVIRMMPKGRCFGAVDLYNAFYQANPAACHNLSTADWEARYPNDPKYRNEIRFGILRARKAGLIRHVRRNVWERV